MSSQLEGGLSPAGFRAHRYFAKYLAWGYAAPWGARRGHGASGELAMVPYTGKRNSCEDGRKHRVGKALCGVLEATKAEGFIR